MKWILYLILFVSGLVIGLQAHRLIAAKQLESFKQSHEIFCKECCWQTEHFYTCTKEQGKLWQRITP
jgi:hypothetical protein